MRQRRTVALAAVVLLVGTAGSVRGQALRMYEDDGEFVEGSAAIFGLSLLVPVSIAAGVVCAPVMAVVEPREFWSKTVACGLVPGVLVGVGGYVVGGAPFKGIKTVFWDLPAGAARRRHRPAVVTPPETPTPAEPPAPPRFPEMEMQG